MWSGPLDSSEFLLSYFSMPLASPTTCQFTDIYSQTSNKLYLYLIILKLIQLRESSKGGDRAKHAAVSWVQQLRNDAQTWMETLATEAASKTLKRSDMDKLANLVVNGTKNGPSSIIGKDQPGLEQGRIAAVMRSFYDSLFSAIAPEFERLQDSHSRELTRLVQV